MSIYKYETKNYPKSYYAATSALAATQSYPSISESLKTDTVIIGGGFCGISAALELAKLGHQVVLVDGRRLCWGASGRNGGHILINYNRGMAYIEKQVGKTVAKALFDLSYSSRELMYERISRYGIECDLAYGSAGVTEKSSHLDDMQATHEHLAKNYDYELEYWDKNRIREEIKSPLYQAGLYDKRNGHCHPLNYGLGLAKAAVKQYGLKIFENSRVRKITQKNDKVHLFFSDGTIEAKQVIVACNAYIAQLIPYLHRRIMTLGSFINTTAPVKDKKFLLAQNIAVSDWNNEVTYFRLSADNRLIFGGGESFFDNAQSPELKARGQQMMKKVFPQLGDVMIDYSWGGHIAITPSRLPHIGRYKKNIYFAQGFSGHGVAITGAVGKLLAEATHAENSYMDVFGKMKHYPLPIGDWFRKPASILAMYYYRLKDKIA